MILLGQLSLFECDRYGLAMSGAGLFAAAITECQQIHEKNRVSMACGTFRIAGTSGREVSKLLILMAARGGIEPRRGLFMLEVKS
jgi:hypothetical protein